LLERHASGDWSSIAPADARENELSLREGFRIVSSYQLPGGAGASVDHRRGGPFLDVPAVAERVLKGGVIELYTSHWRSPLLADVDAQIVSISRGEPRWRLPFRFRRLRQLAPGTEAWSHKADREAFENAYQRQLQEIGAEPILERLEEISAGKPAILLCWERLDKPASGAIASC
jgi:hypothetical protein